MTQQRLQFDAYYEGFSITAPKGPAPRRLTVILTNFRQEPGVVSVTSQVNHGYPMWDIALAASCDRDRLRQILNILEARLIDYSITYHVGTPQVGREQFMSTVLGARPR